MSYSLNLITLPSEADSLTQTAQRDKRVLLNRKETLSIRSESSAEDTVALTAEVASLNSALVTCNMLIETLADGEAKEEQITKKMEIELRLRKISQSGNRLGTVATLEREFDQDQLSRQVEGIDAFIDAVLARKAEL